MSIKDLSGLQKNIGVTFRNVDFLIQAVVHRSYLNEHPEYTLDHNERLEFLGDAVLELIVTEHLFNTYPNPEGELTNWRAALVNAQMLAQIAAGLGIEDYLHMSKGESKDAGTKARGYILANAIEAVIGAIYLDQGYEASKKFVLEHVVVHLQEILAKSLHKDPKSRFQEVAQEVVGMTPSYRVLEESGPDHNKTFKVGLFLGK
ncbi:ribonuclease III, partial [Candidatus Falkowbacteria bacterium]|nr:ribonuclease III [Candidatus Falkowbacteria bacterium]